MEQLYRVYLHTKDDESVRECIVTAPNETEAAARAIRHVNDSNLGKSGRSQADAQALTLVLAVTPTSKPHCLVIHSFPAAAMRQMVNCER